MDDDENRSSNLRRTYSAPILNVNDYRHRHDKFFDAFDGRRSSSSSTGQAGFYSIGSSDATQESLREDLLREYTRLKSQITSQLLLHRRWSDFSLDDVKKENDRTSSPSPLTLSQEEAIPLSRPSVLSLDNTRSSTPSPTWRKIFLTRKSSSPITIASSSNKRKGDDLDFDMDCTTPIKRVARISPASPQDDHAFFSNAASIHQGYSFVYPSPNATISPLALPNSSPSMISSSTTWSPDSNPNSEKGDNDAHEIEKIS